MVQDLTPAETLVLRSIANSTTGLAEKLSDTVLEFIGAIRAAQGPEAVILDGTVPDQLRSHIKALTVWRYLRSFPQFQKIKTKEREEAGKDAERIYEKICARTYGAIESPYEAPRTAGNWNSENKLILRTHPTPPPFAQFPPLYNGVPPPVLTPLGPTLVYAAVAGTPPPYGSVYLTPGQQAINQTTNEQWVVNLNNQWQQTVGV